MTKKGLETRWLWIALGYSLLGAISLVIAPALVLSIDSSYRLLLIRLAAASLTGIVLLHAASYRRAQSLSDTPTDFENALRQRPAAIELDLAFRTWRDEARMAAASRMSFERAARTRLSALAAQLDPAIEAKLKELAPAPRRMARLAQLEAIAALMERQL
jgi:hypothetical protein